VLALAVGHLGTLATLGGRLQAQADWELGDLERALTRLHDSVTALEPDALRGADDERAEVIRACSERALAEMQAFLHRTVSAAAALRPLLVEFQLEFRDVQRVVDRADDWLQEIELARPAPALRSRLELLHAVARSARNTHALAEHVMRTRPKLSETVEGQLRRSCLLLQQRLQGLPHDGAVPAPAAVRALHLARSDAQIWTTQATSLLLRLCGSKDRLVREAAALRHRCSLIPLAGTERGEVQPPLRAAEQLRENMAESS
jgi:hypothetical protein